MSVINKGGRVITRREFLNSLSGSAIMVIAGGEVLSLAGCGGGGGNFLGGGNTGGSSTPSAAVNVTKNSAYTATAFQHQTIVGSAYGSAVSRMLLFHNVANTPNGKMNAMLFGYFDATGLPAGLAEIAAYGTDPSKAVYTLYDTMGRPILVTQPSSGGSMTFADNAANPNQITVTFLSNGSTVAQKIATLDANDNVTLQSVPAGGQGASIAAPGIRAASQQKAHAQSNATPVSIDPDDNPPDNDGDEADTDITACNGNAACITTKMFNAVQNFTVSQLEYNKKVFLVAAALAALLDLPVVAVALTVGAGVGYIAQLVATAPPTTTDVSTDDTGTGDPTFVPGAIP